MKIFRVSKCYNSIKKQYFWYIIFQLHMKKLRDLAQSVVNSAVEEGVRRSQRISAKNVPEEDVPSAPLGKVKWRKYLNLYIFTLI